MTHDVLVLGAGIAGSVVARRLAQAGARVVLVGDEVRPGWEGLSRRAVERLAQEDVLVAQPLVSRRGHWGSRTVEGREYLVERSQLARRLRARAVAAGARHVAGTARDLRRGREGWQVAVASGPLCAASVIDARGRRGAALAGPRLLAVTQAFTVPETEAATHIEALSAGWCWWACVGTRLSVQVTGRPRDGHPAHWLQRAARELPALSGLLAGAVAASPLQGRPAHARLGAPCAHETLWRVGDAAHALDPLSGQGVYEALRSAQLVATAFAAVLAGSERALAREFVRERQQASFHHAVCVAAEFYRENASSTPFWRETARAYEQLAARVAADHAGPPRVEPRPVLIDGRIVLRDVVVTPQHPRGVWQVGGVPVAPILQDPGSVAPAVLESTAQRLGTAPQAVRDAVLWLQQSGAALAGPRLSIS